MSTTRHPRAQRAPRKGFSIVEVIIAMMIIAIGLLGIAGSAALALRTTVTATRQREAAERAYSRLALLVAAGCGHSTSGQSTDPARQLSEQWVVRSGSGFQQLSDTVTWATSSGTRHFALATAVPC